MFEAGGYYHTGEKLLTSIKEIWLCKIYCVKYFCIYVVIHTFVPETSYLYYYLRGIWRSNSRWTGRREMPFITTSKSVYHSPTWALHWATWWVACLIRLIQANPTVTNCALLFTLITPSEEVDLLWVCLRLTSRSQRSNSPVNHRPFTQQLDPYFL